MNSLLIPTQFWRVNRSDCMLYEAQKVRECNLDYQYVYRVENIPNVHEMGRPWALIGMKHGSEGQINDLLRVSCFLA